MFAGRLRVHDGTIELFILIAFFNIDIYGPSTTTVAACILIVAALGTSLDIFLHH